MPLDLATAAHRAGQLSHRQRLLAAEMLAAGDPLVRVAAVVEVDEAVMRVLDVDDGFRRLVDACQALQEMPREAYRERAERLLRGAAERALADGRVSTVNLILRATKALDGPRADDGADDASWSDDGVDPAEGDGLPGDDGPLAGLPPELLPRLTRAQVLDFMLANDGVAVREAFRVAERAAEGIATGRRLRLAAADESGTPYDTGPAYSPLHEGAWRGPARECRSDRAADGPRDLPPAPASGPVLRLAASRDDAVEASPADTTADDDRPDPFPSADDERPAREQAPRPATPVAPPLPPHRRAREPVPEWHGRPTNPRRPRPP